MAQGLQAGVATTALEQQLRPSAPRFRYIDVALGSLPDSIARIVDRTERKTWSCRGAVVSQQREEEGFITLKLLDFPLVNDWGDTFFGRMETHAVVRDENPSPGVAEDKLDEIRGRRLERAGV